MQVQTLSEPGRLEGTGIITGSEISNISAIFRCRRCQNRRCFQLLVLNGINGSSRAKRKRCATIAIAFFAGIGMFCSSWLFLAAVKTATGHYRAKQDINR